MQELYKETDAAGYVCMLSVDSDRIIFSTTVDSKANVSDERLEEVLESKDLSIFTQDVIQCNILYRYR